MDKNNHFKLLSHREESNLTYEKKCNYYEQLRVYCLNRKLKTTTKGASSIGPKLRNITEKIAIKVTKMFSSKDVEWKWDGNEFIPNGPVIFAHSHQGILDGFVWIPEVEKHCIILHGKEVNKILLACQLNTGLVLVVKGDKNNNLDAKLDMIRLLCEGHSISYYPEGTWNLSPNKLLLPMSYGIFDIACKSRVPVIPVVHEYSYDFSCKKPQIVKIHSRYGSPIYVTEKDSLNDKLEEYREKMSTMRWELIEEKGLYKRSSISLDEYKRFLEINFKNLKLGKLDWQKETRYIYGANDEFYQFFPINEVNIEKR